MAQDFHTNACLLVLCLIQCDDVGWCLAFMILSIYPSGLAAWKAVIFWEAMIKSNQWRLTRVTPNHCTYRFIRTMPYTGRWAEVTSILRLFHVHMGAYAPFTFRGVAEFLILVEDRVDSLGNTPLERSDAAIQLINMALIAPAATQQLPITIAERNHIEHRQMRLLFAENPQARRTSE